eukprot:Selendium_serpulae@DN3762_c0_g1_i1.p1
MGCSASKKSAKVTSPDPKPKPDPSVRVQHSENTSKDELDSPLSHGLQHGKSQNIKDQIKKPTIFHSRLTRHIKLNERYLITQEIIGTGINGAVRVATHKDTKKRYAVKTLSLEGIKTRRRSMLHNEVSIYLQLDHPNIAKLIEVFEESDKAIHLIMELCTGKELYDRLASKRKYSEADAKKVTREMLSAINYCHKRRICHRDLKLENWVYASPDEAAPLKLIDFGFSRIFNPGVPMTAMHGTVYYVSPEVMEGCYAEKCDVWSIGVIVYMLLSGSPPFNGGTDAEILSKIKRGVYTFEGPRWEGISNEAKMFVQQLLVLNPDERPEAIDALNHPWLSRRMTEDITIDILVLENMRRFAATNHLKRAALGLIALSMTTRDVAEMSEQFKSMDKDNTGTITMNDLASAIQGRLDMSDSEIEAVFRRIDQTGDQNIHYSEFLASTLQAQIFRDSTLAREAFQKFDVDNTGHITVENLRHVLGDTYNGLPVEDMLRSVDKSSSGAIDYQQFLRAVQDSTEEEHCLVPCS